MRCVICRLGETNPGETTVTLNRGQTTLVFKNVPAEICDNCGEYYPSEDVAARVLEQAERAVESGVEVEVIRFAA